MGPRATTAVLVAAMLAGCGTPAGWVEPSENSPLFNEGLFTPLHLAAAEGSVERIRGLLATGGDVNARSRPDGLTPLYYAAAYGRDGAVEALLTAGADVRAAGAGGDTVFHVAARGEPAAFRRLMALAAKAGAPRSWAGAMDEILEAGNVPLMLDLVGSGPAGRAAAMDDAQLARTAHWGITEGWKDLTVAAIRRCGDLNARRPHGHTLLHQAVRGRWHDVMQLLIDRGADVNADGPLRVAVKHGDEAAVRMLLAARAAPNRRDGGDQPLLHLAIENGHAAVARLLVEKGASLGATDSGGATAAHAVVARGSGQWGADLLRVVTGPGADVNARDKQGQTALLLAVRTNEAWALPVLIDRKADVNLPDSEGVSPLHEAAAAKTPELTGLLLRAGARADIRDGRGRTPLHEASRRGSPEGVKLLLDVKADPNAADKNGVRPLDLAATPQVREVLGGHGAASSGRHVPAAVRGGSVFDGFGIGDGGEGGIVGQIIYIVDLSPSAARNLPAVREDMAHAIDGLKASQAFTVLVLGEDRPRSPWGPARELPRADEANKRRAKEFVRRVVPSGPTRLAPALEEALGMGPAGAEYRQTLIYIFTDGRFVDRHEVIPLLERRRVGVKSPPHVYPIRFGPPASPVMERILGRLAKENEGEYRVVEKK